jgi:hypothetical protein
LSICALAFSIFNIEQVSAAHEGLIMPPVAINSVNSDCLLLSVNYNSFVKAFLGRAEVLVKETKILISSLYNFNCIGIELAHAADSNVLLCEVIVKSPASSLSPVHFFAQMVFGDHVLVILKPKACHFNYYKICP